MDMGLKHGLINDAFYLLAEKIDFQVKGPEGVYVIFSCHHGHSGTSFQIRDAGFLPARFILWILLLFGSLLAIHVPTRATIIVCLCNVQVIDNLGSTGNDR